MLRLIFVFSFVVLNMLQYVVVYTTLKSLIKTVFFRGNVWPIPHPKHRLCGSLQTTFWSDFDILISIMTLQIGSWSPKAKHFSPLPRCCFLASLVRIYKINQFSRQSTYRVHLLSAWPIIILVLSHISQDFTGQITRMVKLSQ